jgi:hypothetical protein
MVKYESATLDRLIPAEGEWSGNNTRILVKAGTTKLKIPAKESITDMSTYVSALPKFRQRLLGRCRPSSGLPFPEALQRFTDAIQAGSVFSIATDGSLSNGYGTFGVILATEEEEFWESGGPVDGDPTTANSKRTELAGYAASLELLTMLLYFSQQSNTECPGMKLRTETWIDNVATQRHVVNLKQQSKPRRKYPHDADILAHIQWLWQELTSVDHNIYWVKGHQDNTQQYHNLPRNAQLNIVADALASQYAEETHRVQLPPSKNPAVFVTLLVNGQRVTAYLKESMRFHINGTRYASLATYKKNTSGQIKYGTQWTWRLSGKLTKRAL